MLRNFLINLFFLIPVWIIKIIFLNNQDVKRNFNFDHQSRALLYLMPKFNLHEISDDEIPKIRELITTKRKDLRLYKNTKFKIKKADHYIDGKNLILREYIPNKIDNNNIILYFHGGGYVLNSIDTHDPTVSYFSENLRTKIYSLEYSLSPEKKFPIAQEEALDALNWLIKQGNDIKNISLCGDSAGAHLAASLSHYLSNNQQDNVHSQFLLYPMCDPECNSESHTIFSNGYLLTNNAMKWFWEKFNNTEKNCKNINTYNLLSLNGNINIPQSIIVTAGFDPLSDEAEKYAFLLHEKNVNVKQLHYPTLFHGFATMTRLKSARRAVDDFLRAYKEIL